MSVQGAITVPWLRRSERRAATPVRCGKARSEWVFSHVVLWPGCSRSLRWRLENGGSLAWGLSEMSAVVPGSRGWRLSGGPDEGHDADPVWSRPRRLSRDR